MSTSEAILTTEESQTNEKTVFGFWLYIMTDCVLFASLFATFAVLRNNTFGGPSGRQIFDLKYVLGETMLLLTSSFTCGMAVLSAQARKKNLVLLFFIITALLGLGFLTMELHEFIHLYQTGDSWRRSGFLSSYFTLVATHGLHITVGLLWIVVSMIQLVRRGLTSTTVRRLTLFSMFWHFLDVVWIFIFTVVYLLGVV